MSRFKTNESLSMKKIISVVACSVVILMLASCATTTPAQQFKGMTSEQIYQSAEKALVKGDYDKAIKYYEGLQALYPFGPNAEQAQLDIVYAYYRNGDAAEATAAAQRYIHLYPQSADVDYAYYLKGLINYTRGRSWLQTRFHVSRAEIDSKAMQQAFVDFGVLIQQFPDSKYAPDAQKRMIYIRNIMAQNELDTAQFYLRQKAYVAAINRATHVVRHYQGAPQVIDALVVMVEANRALGLDKQANDALQILQVNYPNAPQLKKL
jgi:outer membrane protein assembly factor BamD